MSDLTCQLNDHDPEDFDELILREKADDGERIVRLRAHPRGPGIDRLTLDIEILNEADDPRSITVLVNGSQAVEYRF